MKVYQVGGSVRDQLLSIKNNDTDYVVIGSTENEMLSLGFTRVGKSFPVFLHPDTKDEYALARRERSTGNGYNDFVVDTNFDEIEELVRLEKEKRSNSH